MSRIAWGASIEGQQRRVDAELGVGGGGTTTILRQATLQVGVDTSSSHQHHQHHGVPHQGTKQSAMSVAVGVRDSVYSRGAVSEWANKRLEHQLQGTTTTNSTDRNRRGSTEGPATTEFDMALLSPFFGVTENSSTTITLSTSTTTSPSTAPTNNNTVIGSIRSIFRGCVFYLNSCDSDPLVSSYLLEKLIRVMGGITVMGLGSKVTYVVCQHLCSSKLTQVNPVMAAAAHNSGGGLGSGKGSSRGGSNKQDPTSRYIHPHFILLCARVGERLPHAPFRTMVAEAPNSISALFTTTTATSPSAGPLVFPTHAAVMEAAQKHIQMAAANISSSKNQEVAASARRHHGHTTSTTTRTVTTTSNIPFPSASTATRRSSIQHTATTVDCINDSQDDVVEVVMIGKKRSRCGSEEVVRERAVTTTTTPTTHSELKEPDDDDDELLLPGSQTITNTAITLTAPTPVAPLPDQHRALPDDDDEELTFT